MRVVLATANAGKLRELQALLVPLGFLVEPQSSLRIEPPEETGATFLDNALLKAHHAARLATLPALADDSGLEVDALGGLPGVRSARFAGGDASDAANIGKLLEELRGIPAAQRTARYRCIIVFVRSDLDAAPLVGEGVWEGRILREPRGTGGFGYDPVFEVPGTGRTAAELSASEKNALSHRGQALRALAARLAEEGMQSRGCE